MFVEGQKTKYLGEIGQPVCHVVALRVYTDRYAHWDIEVTEDQVFSDNIKYSQGMKMLGVSERSLAPV